MIYYRCDLCGAEQSSGTPQEPSQSNPLGQKLVTITTYSYIKRADNSLEHLCVPCEEKFTSLYKELQTKHELHKHECTKELVNKLKKN